MNSRLMIGYLSEAMASVLSMPHQVVAEPVLKSGAPHKHRIPLKTVCYY